MYLSLFIEHLNFKFCMKTQVWKKKCKTNCEQNYFIVRKKYVLIVFNVLPWGITACKVNYNYHTLNKPCNSNNNYFFIFTVIYINLRELHLGIYCIQIRNYIWLFHKKTLDRYRFHGQNWNRWIKNTKINSRE